MFGMKKTAKNDGKKACLMLVNCGYGLCGFEDDSHAYAIYENRFTGKQIRFCMDDATYEPIENAKIVRSCFAR